MVYVRSKGGGVVGCCPYAELRIFWGKGKKCVPACRPERRNHQLNGLFYRMRTERAGGRGLAVAPIRAVCRGFWVRGFTGPKPRHLRCRFVGAIDTRPGLARRQTVAPVSTHQPQPPATFALTTREVEILALVVDGQTARQIGDRLFISAKTVRKYIENIYGKLHIHSRLEAVRLTDLHRWFQP